MRVRPKTNLLSRRTERGAHPPAHTAPRPAAPAPVPAEDHPQERRARESGGPIDHAQYHCTCGMVFDAPVSTSVTCPNCGTGQAW
jgi:hypothetical protein